jgi:hypothetical protein
MKRPGAYGPGWIDVPTQGATGTPSRHPAEREIPRWQKHQPGASKLSSRRVSGGAAHEVPSLRRASQIPHEGTPIVDSAPTEVVNRP